MTVSSYVECHSWTVAQGRSRREEPYPFHTG